MVKTFGKMLKDYASFKEAKCGSSVITPEETRALRKEFNESAKKTASKVGRMTESKDPAFAKLLKQFASFKESKTGSSEITMNERIALRAKFNESKKAKKADTSFTKVIKEYAAFKEAKTGSARVTAREIHALKEGLAGKTTMSAKPTKKVTKAVEFRTALKEYADFKKLKTGNANAKVTAAEYDTIREAIFGKKSVRDKLNEAIAAVKAGRAALREGDINAAANMAGQAQDALAGIPDPNVPAANVDPAIAQQITDVKTAVDALATAAGVGPAVNLGADPNAGVPPVDGQPAAGAAPADPNAVSMPESRAGKLDLNAIRERIAQRKAELNEGKAASAANPYAVKDLTPTAKQPDHIETRNPGVEDNVSQLAKIPTAKQLLTGTDKNVVRWGAGETTEAPKAAAKMGESEFDKYIFDKFDFNKLYEMTDGVIGRKPRG